MPIIYLKSATYGTGIINYNGVFNLNDDLWINNTTGNPTLTLNNGTSNKSLSFDGTYLDLST